MALSTAAVVALFALLALRPPMPRRSSPFNLQFALGWLINEMPFLGFWWLLAGTVGTLTGPQSGGVIWWLVLALSVVDLLVLARLAARARSARPVLVAALESAFGGGAAPTFTRPPWWRIVTLPFIAWRPDVRRIRNQHYGPSRRGNRLDVFVSRRGRRAAAPMLVYLHGGSTFFPGSKMLGARPLIYRLAARGWVCTSVAYRQFGAGEVEQLADVRAALAWMGANAHTYGGDPQTAFLAGGSSGAHLAVTAALSGAELSGVIGLYGYYGDIGASDPAPASAHARVNRAAPPFLILHGALDTLVLSKDARRFAEHLRGISRQPVGYGELPGTQHNFDFFHSPRTHWVTDAVLRFAELAVNRPLQHERGS